MCNISRYWLTIDRYSDILKYGCGLSISIDRLTDRLICASWTLYKCIEQWSPVCRHHRAAGVQWKTIIGIRKMLALCISCIFNLMTHVCKAFTHAAATLTAQLGYACRPCSRCSSQNGSISLLDCRLLRQVRPHAYWTLFLL